MSDRTGLKKYVIILTPSRLAQLYRDFAKASGTRFRDTIEALERIEQGTTRERNEFRDSLQSEIQRTAKAMGWRVHTRFLVHAGDRPDDLEATVYFPLDRSMTAEHWKSFLAYRIFYVASTWKAGGRDENPSGLGLGSLYLGAVLGAAGMMLLAKPRVESQP